MERGRGADRGLDTIAKLGAYLKAIQEADERFTGRAIKNITDAVKVRAMDFELPDEWMEEPELFLFKGYDEKAAMISELRRPITVEMVVQEINRYADSEFRYADKSDEVAIEGAGARHAADGGGQAAVSGGEGVSEFFNSLRRLDSWSPTAGGFCWRPITTLLVTMAVGLFSNRRAAANQVFERDLRRRIKIATSVRQLWINDLRSDPLESIGVTGSLAASTVGGKDPDQGVLLFGVSRWQAKFR